MKWIVIRFLKNRIKLAEANKSKKGSIVEKAYENMINNYEGTIMFLEAE